LGSNGYRLGFEGPQVLEDFQPASYLSQEILGDQYEDSEINALANIAVIGPSINIRISAKNRMEYLKKYKITPDKLEQQFITKDLDSTPLEKYTEFLKVRAQVLATETNKYLADLQNGIEAINEEQAAS
jgi:hypothetical protein